MNILTCPATLTQITEVPGLIRGHVEHTIKEAKGHFDYTGPQISPELWAQILAFFRWSYETSKSETQVRLFVNLNLGRWAAWAFPQKYGTGMTATELPDNPETEAQRAQFPDSAGWLPFGTVHHHCTASAFQSGTDERNEKNQDGLHLTVGHLTKETYDLHARLYLRGHGVEVNLAEFYQIDASALLILPPIPEIHHQMARWAMCQPPPEATTFPDIWRTNLIEEPKPTYFHSSYPSHPSHLSHNSFWPDERDWPTSDPKLQTTDPTDAAPECPECKSQDIHFIQATPHDDGTLEADWHCLECRNEWQTLYTPQPERLKAEG